MARIAVDIDSTLYNFEEPAREAFTKLAEQTGDREYLRGAYHPWTEWRSPADACGLDKWLEAIDLCHSADVILAQRPFNGAVETCQALADEGHELLYISNRAVETAEATHQWLKEWDFPLDANITEAEEWHGGHALKCLTTDKKPFLKDCQYLIDDRPKTVIDFIYDREWENRVADSADLIRRVGPPRSETEIYGRHIEALDRALEAYYNSDRELTKRELEAVSEIGVQAAEEYISANRRRAFVIAYPYNQALTDIPHLYLAPTWAGLNDYMVGKGVLSKPAYHALGAS